MSKLKKELETKKDKSLNMDELKKNLESKKLQSIKVGECVEENSSLKKDLDSEKIDICSK